MQERDFGCSGRLNASWTLGMKKFRNSERKDHRSLTCACRSGPLLLISGIIETDSLPQRRISVWLMLACSKVSVNMRTHQHLPHWEWESVHQISSVMSSSALLNTEHLWVKHQSSMTKCILKNALPQERSFALKICFSLSQMCNRPWFIITVIKVTPIFTKHGNEIKQFT